MMAQVILDNMFKDYKWIFDNLCYWYFQHKTDGTCLGYIHGRIDKTFTKVEFVVYIRPNDPNPHPDYHIRVGRYEDTLAEAKRLLRKELKKEYIK